MLERSQSSLTEDEFQVRRSGLVAGRVYRYDFKAIRFVRFHDRDSSGLGFKNRMIERQEGSRKNIKSPTEV